MRYVFSVILSIWGFLVFPLPLFAQSSPSAQRNLGVRKLSAEEQKMEKPFLRDSIKRDIDQSSESSQEKRRVNPNRVKNAIRLLSLTFDRFDAGIARLETLIERIESRLEKLASRGATVSEILPKVAATKEKLALAKDSLEQVKIEVNGLETIEDPKTAFIGIKQEISRIRDEIGGVHASLIQVVVEMKNVTSTSDFNSSSSEKRIDN